MLNLEPDDKWKSVEMELEEGKQKTFHLDETNYSVEVTSLDQYEAEIIVSQEGREIYDGEIHNREVLLPN